MKWYSLPLVLAVLVAPGLSKSPPQPEGIVYLIDELADSKPKKNAEDNGNNVIPDEGDTSKRGVLLASPIAEKVAGDGVYFRPEGGKPVAEGKVSVKCTKT